MALTGHRNYREPKAHDGRERTFRLTTVHSAKRLEIALADRTQHETFGYSEQWQFLWPSAAVAFTVTKCCNFDSFTMPPHCLRQSFTMPPHCLRHSGRLVPFLIFWRNELLCRKLCTNACTYGWEYGCSIMLISLQWIFSVEKIKSFLLIQVQEDGSFESLQIMPRGGMYFYGLGKLLTGCKVSNENKLHRITSIKPKSRS